MNNRITDVSKWWLVGLLAVLGACGPTAEEEAPAAEEPEGLPEVHLDEDALALVDISMDVARLVSAGGLRVTGTITYDQNRVSHVGPKTEGRVTSLGADLGDRVREGDELARLESPVVGTTRAELVEAQALLDIAQETFDRETRLQSQGISSRREVLEAEAALRTIEARLRSAEERLRLYGATERHTGGLFDLVAPYDGVVVERHAARGEVVGPEDQVFTIADLSRLWIELDVFERDLTSVAVGQSVEVATAAWPGRTFPARIVYVGDILDSVTRTVRTRVELGNDDGALKPGMFATAMVATAGAALVVSVPRSAVQNIEGDDIVWLAGDEPGEFVASPVLIGEELPGDLIEIVSGLLEGESVVIVGAFTLKAELAKGDFGGHGH